jgi:hypothetical protein
VGGGRRISGRSETWHADLERRFGNVLDDGDAMFLGQRE